MERPTSASPTSSTRVAVIFQRILQALLLVVVGSVIYRYCWTDAVSDPLKCAALLNKGEWLDPGPRRGSRNRFRNWQPPGCSMREYNKEDIPECFQERRLVFAGDSTVRQIFWAVAKKMDLRKAEKNITDMFTFDQLSEDLEFSAHGVTVQYIWDPYLNSTRLRQELRQFRTLPSPLGVENGDMDPDASAASILLGAPGLWYARHGQENYFKEFRDAIDGVIPYMDHSGAELGTPAIGPSRARKESPNLLLFAPVQEPRYQNLSPSREATITPEKIDQMNDYLQQVSAHSKADIIWSYSLMTWAARGTYEESGLHVIENVALRKADVLLNLRCNSDAAFQGRRLKGTCCLNYNNTAVPQWLILIAGMLVLPVLACLRRKRAARSASRLPAPEVIEAMAILGLVLCFCFFAERTHIFEKGHKQFNRRRLLMAFVGVAVGGLLSAKRNSKTQPIEQHKGIASPDDDRVLPRQQTDEWKGWIQAIILILSFSQGSEKLWVYQIMRLLVSAYLFLTGFGHTIYFLESNDYSLRRVATVLIRLNLLGCLLPNILRTDSEFYSYIPLVTFWTLIIYATLQYRREENSRVDFLVEKILVSALFTTAFVLIPGFLELVGFAMRYSCGISWDMTAWRARLYLDMYIVFIGMLTAVLINQARQLKTGRTAATTIIDIVLQYITRYSRLWNAATIALSLILPPVLWLITRRSPDEEDYNWWHPFISFIPILSFITLRNAHRILRERHLSLFAWLSRQSLETYVLHHHIWLANDAQGLLRLGLWSGLVEAAILTPVFLWVSGAAANATRVLTAWIVSGAAEGACLGDTRFSTKREGGIGKTQSRIWNDLRWRLTAIALVLWVGGLLRGVST